MLEIDAVAEARDQLLGPEPTADRFGAGDPTLTHLTDQVAARLGRTAVQRSAERGEPGADHEVGVGPRRCRDPGRQGGRRQLVVSEEHQSSLQLAHTWFRCDACRDPRPESCGDGGTGGRRRAHERQHLDDGGDDGAGASGHRRGPAVVAQRVRAAHRDHRDARVWSRRAPLTGTAARRAARSSSGGAMN